MAFTKSPELIDAAYSEPHASHSPQRIFAVAIFCNDTFSAVCIWKFPNLNFQMHTTQRSSPVSVPRPKTVVSADRI